jgi:PAS domain S-box-containing protein
VSELREDAARDAAAFVSGADLVVVVGPDGLLRHASPRWVEIFGEPARLGRPVYEAMQPERLDAADALALGQWLAAALAGSAGSLVPLAVPHAVRGRCVLEGRCYGPREPSGNRVVVFHDVTERAAALDALIERDRRFRTIADATGDMVTETDAKGRFTYASSACGEVLGYPPDELVGENPMGLLHPEDRGAFQAAVGAESDPGVPFTVPPHRLRRRDGSWLWVEATGVWYERADGERRLIGAARDITARLESAAARRELEEQVRHTQKLESLGALTGGIAHDFNNLLTPVLGAASLLLQEIPEDSRYRRRVETIQQAARRAADLTGQMLSYAGGTDLELRPVDLSELVREMQLLLESSVSREARLEWRLEEALPRVLADPGQLSQVIVNLIVNASEALGASGRKIELRTESLEADRSLLDACVLGEQREAGRYVALAVRDDGEGIPAEALERVFDPFFTTKFTGRGLGLAMVVGIVRGHGGALQVESAPGIGTTFRILLPLASPTAAAPAGSPEAEAGTTAPWTPSGVFLVVDDDEGARDFVATLLERSGIEVQVASDGAEAVAILEQHGSRVAGVVLDATMPGLTGAPLLARIDELAPQVRILLISGFSRERVEGATDARDHLAFLRKPFEPEQLLDALRALFE